MQTPDGGVYFAPAAWRKVQSSYIGDRQSWQQERRHLLAQVQQSESGKTAKEQQADALLAKLNELFSDPDKLVAESQNWQIRGPILKADAERQAAIAERDQLAAQLRERQEEEEADRLRPQLQQWLGQEVEQALGEYDGVFEREQAVALLRELWEQHAGQVFYEDPRTGKIHLDQDRLRGLIESRAEWVRKARAGMQKVQEKKATNAAVLAPTKPGVAPKPVTPKVEVPRDDQGRFQPVNRKQAKRAARDLLDDLKLEDVIG